MKMNGFARIVLIVLVVPIIFLVNNSSAQMQPPTSVNQGTMIFNPYYAFAVPDSQPALVAFTPNSVAWTTMNANVFIVFDPPTNSINIGTGYLNVDVYTIPSCNPFIPLTDACVLAEAPNVPASTPVYAYSQDWLPQGQYYYLGYIDTTPKSSTGTYAGVANTLTVFPDVDNYEVIGGNVIPPGASTDITFEEYGTGCTDATMLELSAPGASCVTPTQLGTGLTTSSATANVYCNEAVTTDIVTSTPSPLGPPYPNTLTTTYITIDNPYPPCQADYANYTYSSNSQTQCTISYITNATIPAGTYNLCAWYQTTTASYSSASPQRPTGPLSLALGTLNITPNFGASQLSYGEYLTSSMSTFDVNGLLGTPVLTLNANTVSGSPYWDYYTSLGQSSPPAACNNADSSTGAGCYFEVALSNSTEGCAPPAYGKWGSNLRYAYGGCIADGTQPCLLQNPINGQAFGGYASVDLTPQVLQPYGNYLICAYDAVPVEYPPASSGGTPISASNQNKGTPLDTSNQNQIAPIFFATIDMTCVNGVCSFGQSVPEENDVVLGSIYATLGAPNGFVIVRPSSLYTTTGPTTSEVIVNVTGVVNNPVNLYFSPTSSASLSQNTVATCASATKNIFNLCTGGAGDANGCFISFTPSATPPGNGDSVNCEATDPSGIQCTCSEYLSSTGLGSGIGDACNLTTSTPSTMPPVGHYIYCETYNNKFVAAGLFTVANTATTSGTPPGAASAGPLTMELCSAYGTITSILLIFALALALVGAALYEGAQILPAQARGSLQGWAIGMILGGIVGIAIAAFSFTVVSIVANTPITSLLTACAAVS